MFNIPYNQIISNQRRLAELTQTEAATKVGWGLHRWNDIERGKRRPTVAERQAIYELLGVERGFVRPARVLRRLCDNGRKALDKPPLYLPTQDRPPHIRYFSLLRQHRDVTQRITDTIRRRSDYKDCEFFCHGLALDSYLEALHVMRLLEAGATPALLPPARLARTPRPIVDPVTRSPISQHKMLCLVLEGSYYFFQISFTTPQVLRVDCLRWSGKWTAIEIDGEGHDGRNDPQRSQLLELPVVRISADELLLRSKAA